MTSFYKDKTVFITGCTGFKGSWLCKLLKELGAKKIVGYSLKPPTEPSLFKFSKVKKDITYIEGDILDYTSLFNAMAMAMPDIVIHLAAQPIVLKGYADPRLTYETNVMGTVNVLDACKNINYVKTILNVTTDKVYENNETGIAFKEEDRLNGFDPYSNSKSCSELVTSSYYNSFLKDNKTVITARAGNVIGGGDFSPNRIVVDSVRSLSQWQPIFVRNPQSTRPYQYVLDALYAYLLIIEKTYETNKLYNYNVGPDYSNVLRTGDLATMICEYWAPRNPGWISTEPKKDPNTPHEAGKLTLDCSKIKEEIGWQQCTSIGDTVQLTVDWYTNFYMKKDITKEQIKQFIKRIK